MVAFNEYRVVRPDEDETKWSDDFDNRQHMRDLAFWSGLSLCIGIFIGMAIVSYWR